MGKVEVRVMVVEEKATVLEAKCIRWKMMRMRPTKNYSTSRKNSIILRTGITPLIMGSILRMGITPLTRIHRINLHITPRRQVPTQERLSHTRTHPIMISPEGLPTEIKSRNTPMDLRDQVVVVGESPQRLPQVRTLLQNQVLGTH